MLYDIWNIIYLFVKKKNSIFIIEGRKKIFTFLKTHIFINVG